MIVTLLRYFLQGTVVARAGIVNQDIDLGGVEGRQGGLYDGFWSFRVGNVRLDREGFFLFLLEFVDEVFRYFA